MHSISFLLLVTPTSIIKYLGHKTTTSNVVNLKYRNWQHCFYMIVICSEKKSVSVTIQILWKQHPLGNTHLALNDVNDLIYYSVLYFSVLKKYS